MPVPLLIENTAGGDNAMARRLDRLAMLWDAIGQAEGGDTVGLCLDTCHAHAGGEELADASSSESRRSPAGSTSSTPTTRATSSTPAPTAMPTSVQGHIDPTTSSPSSSRRRARGV